MKRILVTGANGLLGSNLIPLLVNSKDYSVYTLTRSKQLIIQNYNNKNIKSYDLEDFANGKVPFDMIDIVIHLAFARAHKQERDIASSLQFTSDIFEIASLNNSNIINASTQEVYGNEYNTSRDESSEILPKTYYALAKYSSELILKSYTSFYNINSTNLRLPGLLGINTDSRMVNKFVKNAICDTPINITGGTQVFSQLDVRDAANGIIALLKIPSNKWKAVYNLGFKKSYNIIDIAQTVAKVAKKHKLPKVKIKINKTDDTFFADIDSSLFYADTNWRPNYNMELIIENIFDNLLENKQPNA